LRKSKLSKHVINYPVYKPQSVSSTLEPDRPHQDHLAIGVIAQQYFSATFVPLRFPEIYVMRFKNFTV
jgi:LmbE family N-acetylglucosaminyl deacetylase